MLYIRLGEFTDNCIIDVSAHFDLVKKPEWFQDNFIKYVIKGIDNTDVIEGEFLKSPVFGGMSPDKLSSGCKAVILMKMNSEYIVYATRCGDNCFPFVQELADEQDVTILLHHCPDMPDDIHAIFTDSGKEVFNKGDFIDEYYRIRHSITKL